MARDDIVIQMLFEKFEKELDEDLSDNHIYENEIKNQFYEERTNTQEEYLYRQGA